MNEQTRAQINLALAICAHDGLISEAEVASLRSHYCDSGIIAESDFEQIIEVFFDEEKSLEERFSDVDDTGYALQISEEAASADGLDIRENFALQKCYVMHSEKKSKG